MAKWCAVEGCVRIHRGRGYCGMHLGRVRKMGNPGGINSLRYIGFNGCSVDDCIRPHRGRGYCSMHLQRLQRAGDPGKAAPFRRPIIEDEMCVVDECRCPQSALGYCSMHVQRLRRHGSVGPAHPHKAPKGSRLVGEVCQKCGVRKAASAVIHGKVRSTGRCQKCATFYRQQRTYLRHRKSVCSNCGYQPFHVMELDVDHIVLRSRGGTDDPSNLQTLCRTCHRRKTLVERGILPVAAYPSAHPPAHTSSTAGGL